MAQVVLFILDRSAEVDALATTNRKLARKRWTRRGDFCDIVDIFDDGEDVGSKIRSDPHFAVLTVTGRTAAQIRNRLEPDTDMLMGAEGLEVVEVQRRRHRFDAGTLVAGKRRRLFQNRVESVGAVQWSNALKSRPRID